MTQVFFLKKPYFFLNWMNLKFFLNFFLGLGVCVPSPQIKIPEVGIVGFFREKSKLC